MSTVLHTLLHYAIAFVVGLVCGGGAMILLRTPKMKALEKEVLTTAGAHASADVNLFAERMKKILGI